MRPKFLDQPYFSQRTPRTDSSQVDYASPVVINTRSRSWTWLQALVVLAGAVAVGALFWV